MEQPHARAYQVFLNLYDVPGNGSESVTSLISKLNRVGRDLGIGGVFHGAIQIDTYEWSYGWCPSGTGVYVVEAQKNPMYAFRETISLGPTLKSKQEIKAILHALKSEWQGAAYDLLSRNCCHFCDAMADRLGVQAIPGWVNRFASSAEATVAFTTEAMALARNLSSSIKVGAASSFGWLTRVLSRDSASRTISLPSTITSSSGADCSSSSLPSPSPHAVPVFASRSLDLRTESGVSVASSVPISTLPGGKGRGPARPGGPNPPPALSTSLPTQPHSLPDSGRGSSSGGSGIIPTPKRVSPRGASSGAAELTPSARSLPTGRVAKHLQRFLTARRGSGGGGSGGGSGASALSGQGSDDSGSPVPTPSAPARGCTTPVPNFARPGMSMYHFAGSSGEDDDDDDEDDDEPRLRKPILPSSVPMPSPLRDGGKGRTRGRRGGDELMVRVQPGPRVTSEQGCQDRSLHTLSRQGCSSLSPVALPSSSPENSPAPLAVKDSTPAAVTSSASLQPDDMLGLGGELSSGGVGGGRMSPITCGLLN